MLIRRAVHYFPHLQWHVPRSTLWRRRHRDPSCNFVRFFRVLDWSAAVFEQFSGRFTGKTSPVHLFWHSFDLAATRFSGRPGLELDDPVDREAYSHEVISFGFWPGDDRIGDAAYYSYTSPEPDGLRDERLASGEWIEFGAGSLALLRYDDVSKARDPRTMLLDFGQSAYEAGARRAGWDTATFESDLAAAAERGSHV